MMQTLNSLEQLLAHIKDVQLDVKELSYDSLMKMSRFIERNNLEVDEDVTIALQYQDIITQQLSAIVEAIESTQNCLVEFKENATHEIEERLSNILQEAKEKKDRFSGKSVDADDEIEFF